MSLSTHARDAFALCDQLRAQGTPDAEIYRALERFLRAMLPDIQAREYDCEVCSDSGVEVFQCPARPCFRRKTHGPHDYVKPCFCAAGERWKVKPKTDEDAIAAAARTTKPKPMSRFGR
jgi:hypothetical protein